MRTFLFAACLLMAACLAPTASAQDADEDPGTLVFYHPCIGFPLWDYVTPVGDFAECMYDYTGDVVFAVYDTVADLVYWVQCDIIGGPVCIPILLANLLEGGGTTF